MEADEPAGSADTFGLEVEPGVPSVVRLEPGQVLLLTLATLGEKVKKNDRAVLKLDLGDQEITVCSLVPFVQESVQLDLPISQPQVTFSVAGAKDTPVHLLGRFVADYDDEDDEDEDGGMELTPEQLYSGMMGDMDSDSDDEDFDGEEEEEELTPEQLYSGMMGDMDSDSDDEDFDGEEEEEDDEEEDEDEDEDEDADEDEDVEEDEDEDNEEDNLAKKLAKRFPNRSAVQIKVLEDDDVDLDVPAGLSDEVSDDEDIEEEEEVLKQTPPKAKPASRKGKDTTSRKRGREEAAETNGKASPATTSKAPRVSSDDLSAEIKAALKANKTMQVSDLGNHLGVKFKTQFKKLGHGPLKPFIAKLKFVDVKGDNVSLKKKAKK
eukprot:CAMPEP_0202117656 /NCGR_PEP_ID=MMETSP0965-20130614/42757_1 /ASSEMBLY_ACC=CAM_ASM_000507 /TAXON_ID=4773 /ORGANISM="Schizochytrium aggregatum, Strain ATCC28209" /LENGTH=378 /DNA_ID=CAMNT_0048687575 /DNA_START=60 /DNA_END=1196 /DNA_ORIENTATION=-